MMQPMGMAMQPGVMQAGMAQQPPAMAPPPLPVPQEVYGDTPPWPRKDKKEWPKKEWPAKNKAPWWEEEAEKGSSTKANKSDTANKARQVNLKIVTWWCPACNTKNYLGNMKCLYPPCGFYQQSKARFA